MTAPIAAVTGGTGFLGRHVVDALTAAGWRVRLLVRHDPGQFLPAHRSIERVPGDLGDEHALSRLVCGASAVVHVAGLVKALRQAEFMAVNRDGTARLAAAVASLAPDARVVLVSSQAARAPGLSAYAASKRAGEAALMAALPATSWIILRPCVVYGPWDTEGTTLLRMASRRIVPVPASPEPRIAMIHARDAAAAIAALCRGGPSGVVLELSDERRDGYPWREIVRTAAAALGRTPRFLPLPDRAVLAIGDAADRWAAVTRRPVMFGRGKAREILQRDWSSDPAMQPPSGLWAPAIGLREGLRETIAWWAREGQGSALDPLKARLENPII